MAQTLQELANEKGMKVYYYRMKDNSLDYSFDCKRAGEILHGKIIKEVMGAFVPTKEVTPSTES